MSSAERDRKRTQKRQNILRRYKERYGCSECRYKDHAAAIDFNHLDPSTKSFNLSDGNKLRKVSWQKVKEEARKCNLLCANCHRIHTYNER